MKDTPSLDELSSAVRSACEPAYVPKIIAARDQVLAMPRDWVLANLLPVARETLDLADEWHYRRLLELAKLLGVPMLREVIEIGKISDNPDVREAADDFSIYE